MSNQESMSTFDVCRYNSINSVVKCYSYQYAYH